MPKSRKRSPCPVACTLDLIGDKWTLLLVRDMLCGKSQYSEFTRSPERIATNILADRLEKLVAAGLVERRPASIGGSRESYHLTERGLSLLPVLQALRDWGLGHIPGTAAHMEPRAAGPRR